MKNIFICLTVVLLTTLSISCGSDDKPVIKPKLELISNSSFVEVGETVLFTVRNGLNIIKDAEIVGTNGAVVVDGKFVAKEVGEYSFTAKKNNYADSHSVKIKVVSANSLDKEKKLVLSIEPAESYKVNVPVVLKVEDENGQAVEGARFIVNGQKFGFNSDKDGVVYLPISVVGHFKIKAFKDDIESNEVSVDISYDTAGYIGYNGETYDLDIAKLTYEAEDANGTPKIHDFQDFGIPGEFFKWTIYSEGDLDIEAENNNFKNKLIFRFVAPVEYDSEGKPIFSINNTIFYNAVVITNNEVVPADLIKAGGVEFLNFDYNTKKVGFRIQLHPSGQPTKVVVVNSEFKGKFQDIVPEFNQNQN